MNSSKNSTEPFSEPSHDGKTHLDPHLDAYVRDFFATSKRLREEKKEPSIREIFADERISFGAKIRKLLNIRLINEE